MNEEIKCHFNLIKDTPYIILGLVRDIRNTILLFHEYIISEMLRIDNDYRMAKETIILNKRLDK